ncbi:MbtH family protein [Streptomyces sp. NBC_00285]|uniref:MbtH family protein n=1 Tax=Streptomyces sp. NBC_00285 TaxID=2975700 RepID=UPI002E29950A|nr:MbtH family protein [Streptomyces sp. NBC_00285]
MATNPFEESDGRYVVLVNDEGQHSLWPAHIEQPSGWELVKSEASKPEAMEFIEANWTDMRPRSVVAALAS